MIASPRSSWCIGILAGLSIGSASAATLQFRQTTGYTTGAVTIRNDTPDANINGNTQVIVGNVNTIVLRGLFEFELSAIETAAAGNPYTIDSVTLTVTTSSAGGSGTATSQFNLSLLGSNSDFDEAMVTWNNAPSVVGGTVGTFLVSTAFDPSTVSTPRVFDSSSAFTMATADALAGSDNTIRLIMTADVENGGYLTRLNTNEHNTESLRPVLTVNYTVVPEPAAGALLVAGMAFLCVKRRRK